MNKRKCKESLSKHKITFQSNKFILQSKKGITLIALVITIIVMLILAGVSLNATIGENGILTRAKDAKEAQELAKTKEDLEYMFLDYNVWQSEKKTISEFLKNKMESGEIEEFRAYPVNNEFKMVIKKEGKYFFVEQEDGIYKAVQMGGLSDENSDFTIVTREEFKNVVDGSMKFELANDKKTTLIFYDEIEDALNFDIVSGNVTIYMTQDMTLTNRGLKRSAVDVHSGATLNLYVLENVKLTVDSGYGEDANGNVPGKGGYAGIHVPEGATLNLYGKGTIEAFGGNAGNGGTFTKGGLNGNGAGGGGAGAGIGGNGGNGGQYLKGIGADGENGENCGNVNIYNSITVYSYGGAGGSGGAGNYATASAGGAGGYPAAGIGGGGAGGAGGTCCAGAGGYTGGSGDMDESQSENGLSGGNGERTEGGTTFLGGGGYFEGAEGTDRNGLDRRVLTFGGMHNQGYWENLRDHSGNGGIAGTGGTIRVSNNANIYSYNGNLYTDGTSYNNGLNQCPIYLQAGIVTAKYTYNINYGGSQSYLLFELQLKSASSTSTKSGYKNMKYNDTNVSNRYITKNTVLTNVDMLEQGVGSGAGYIEVSNGTYIIDANMN